MTVLSWISVDARTGSVLAELPGLVVGSISRTICRYESATASLPLPGVVENWMSATRPGAAVMILLSGDVPIWGGLVTQRTRSSGDEVVLSLATIEAYLDRRFVGDVTYAQIGQNAIVASLVGAYVAAGPLGGIPLRVQYATPGVGALRDRAYLSAADKSVYSIMTELSGVTGGPEFTIEWEHLSGPERYTPVLYVGDRVGTAVVPGLAPGATFDLPGCVTVAQVVEDYSGGKGANSVTAVSTAVADVRPTSPAQLAADDGRPTFEHRFTPSSSITVLDTLTSHAARALAILAPGSVAITLTADMGSAPVLGADWVLGDDIGYQLGGLVPDPRTTTVPTYDDVFVDTFTDQFLPTGTALVLINPAGIDSVPAFPGGMAGIARCIGWDLALTNTPTITPILATTGV